MWAGPRVINHLGAFPPCSLSLDSFSLCFSDGVSAKLVSFAPVCYYCGITEDSIVEDDETQQLRQEYAVVRPLCFLCKSEGKTHFMKMPTNVKKHRRLS